MVRQSEFCFENIAATQSLEYTCWRLEEEAESAKLKGERGNKQAQSVKLKAQRNCKCKKRRAKRTLTAAELSAWRSAEGIPSYFLPLKINFFA